MSPWRALVTVTLPWLSTDLWLTHTHTALNENDLECSFINKYWQYCLSNNKTNTSFPSFPTVSCCMWFLQVTLVAMVNNILSINRLKLETYQNLCSLSAFSDCCAVSPSVSVSLSSMTQPVFIQLVSMERPHKPFHPSPFLSLSSLSIILFCLTFLMCGCFLVHEHFWLSCMCLGSGMLMVSWKGTSVCWWCVFCCCCYFHSSVSVLDSVFEWHAVI